MSKNETFTLNNGTKVLARLYKGKPEPVTYANRTQAEKAAAKCSGTVYHPLESRCWYITKDGETE